MPKKETALVAITKHGYEIAKKLKAHLPEADLLVSSKFVEGTPSTGVIPMAVSISQKMGELFQEYENLILVISLGAVVRMIAPHLKDKHTDPAVVVVDDKAQFAISVLSGHVGGANALTEKVAAVLKAQPVITTASDVGKTIPVDILGRELGWKTEEDQNITRVSAAVVNEEPIAFIQETGEPNWWSRPTPLPKNIERVDSFEAAQRKPYGAYLVVTDRILTDLPDEIAKKIVVYRPKSLVLGMGCDRGTSLEELEELVTRTLEENKLSIRSVRNLVSLEAKRTEKYLLALAEKYGWPISFYSKEELEKVQNVENPSEVVRKWVGTPSVSEAACLLNAGAEKLLVPKVKSQQATLAIARVNFEKVAKVKVVEGAVS